MAKQVTIDADELQALRTLARKHLSSSESDSSSLLDASEEDGNGCDSDETRTPFVLSRPITWQELNVVEALSMAMGAVVPANRLVKHIHNSGVRAVADRWVQAPTSQVTRAKQHLKHKFGMDCIETVWNTKVNSKGRVVRDWKAGIRGYRWVGPDLAGTALEVLTGGD